jgi:hypothetical protein
MPEPSLTDRIQHQTATIATMSADPRNAAKLERVFDGLKDLIIELQHWTRADAFLYLTLPTDILEQPIESLRPSTKLRNILLRNDIYTIEDLLEYSLPDLMRIDRFGPTHVDELQALLEAKDWHLAWHHVDPPPGDSWIRLPNRTMLRSRVGRAPISQLATDRLTGVRWSTTVYNLHWLDQRGIGRVGDLTRLTRDQFCAVGWLKFGQNEQDKMLIWADRLLKHYNLSWGQPAPEVPCSQLQPA